MMKMIFIGTLLIMIIHYYTIAIDNAPFTLTISDSPAPGYLIMDSYQNGLFYMTDNVGYPIFIKNLNNNLKILNPKLQPDGMISFISGNRVYLMNNKYQLADSFNCVGGYDIDFHDFLILPNGNAVLFGSEKRTMNLILSQSSEGKDVLVTGSIIQEIGKNKQLLFHWSSFDHYEIADVVPAFDPTQSSLIASHLNSIFYDSDGNFIISDRARDEITKIDGKSGNIIWRLGGKECKNNQFRYLNDTIDGFYGFSHQHSVTRIPNGNFLLFDNGNLKPKPYSRVVEYKLDEINKTIEKVWEYSVFPEIFSQSMGNAQRLPNGNTLIGWGINQRNKTATEVKPDGSKALEIVGFQSYAVYKNIFKMRAGLQFVDKPGEYDFTDSANNTRIMLVVNKLMGKGYISVENHFYQPHNLEFSDQYPYDLKDERWVVSQNGINEIDATIRFYVNIDSTNDVNEYFIFYREFEGKGIFTSLETKYNIEDKYFETDIKGFGEFIIGMLPSIPPPLGLNPPDSAVDVGILSPLSWQPFTLVSSYRLQVSKTPDFKDLAIDTSGITNTWLYLYFNYNTKYYWRVKAF